MKTASNGEPDVSAAASLGAGSWAILIVLLPLLAGTFAVVYLGRMIADGIDVPASGYVAIVLGMLVLLGVGFDVIALIFYSGQKGYDEPSVLILLTRDNEECGAIFKSKEMN